VASFWRAGVRLSPLPTGTAATPGIGLAERCYGAVEALDFAGYRARQETVFGAFGGLGATPKER